MSLMMFRRLPGILSLSALFAFSLSATTITYQVTTDSTTDTGSYQYTVSGFDFRANAPAWIPSTQHR